ncbi:hypothetical protein K4F52_002465 [Lecanicillium sp. MT-2017a]|nr:hypothetical protein K4F52_002465 [Lecanicillium sp. MT-2017a]
MKLVNAAFCILLSLGSPAAALPSGAGPTIDAPVQGPERFLKTSVSFADGKSSGRLTNGVEYFSGIPFACPPVGDLRLRPPKRLDTKVSHDGTGVSPACPQMIISTGNLDFISKTLGNTLQIPFLKPLNGKEDCLTISVQRPYGVKAGAKLPVLYWMFGGGFELGSANTYDASSLLKAASRQGQPFIFVAVNYRINGFGFMGGKELQSEGSVNLGHLDQRMGLEWVADNIEEFGGDPDKVTIWGESAGSISVYNQMLMYGGNATYKGKPLFRGAIMDSGSGIPVQEADGRHAQEVYDKVVSRAGCGGETDSLSCLRRVSYDTFYNAVTSLPGIVSYNSVALAYVPRPDGTVLPYAPYEAARRGLFHKVPMIIGDQEDEGTLFALFTNNITNTDRLITYLNELYFPHLTRSKIGELADLYPENAIAGSPFRTGFVNELYPGYKRLAAMLGDLVFTLARRLSLTLIHEAAPEVPTWSYLSSYYHSLPFMGTFHASDIAQIFYGGLFPAATTSAARTYYFNFLYNLDPNQGVTGNKYWPQWADGKKLMWFKDLFTLELLPDDFRKSVTDYLQQGDNMKDFSI